MLHLPCPVFTRTYSLHLCPIWSFGAFSFGHLAHFGLIEIKLGGDKLIADGVKTLNALSQIIDTTRMKSPAFKMVLVGVGNMPTNVPTACMLCRSVAYVLDDLSLDLAEVVGMYVTVK